MTFTMTIISTTHVLKTRQYTTIPLRFGFLFAAICLGLSSGNTTQPLGATWVQDYP